MRCKITKKIANTQAQSANFLPSSFQFSFFSFSTRAHTRSLYIILRVRAHGNAAILPESSKIRKKAPKIPKN